MPCFESCIVNVEQNKTYHKVNSLYFRCSFDYNEEMLDLDTEIPEGSFEELRAIGWEIFTPFLQSDMVAVCPKCRKNMYLNAVKEKKERTIKKEGN